MNSENPICQSCGLPLRNEEDCGTNADNSRNETYCHFCYQNGTFTKPDLTLEKQSERLIEIAVASGMSQTEAEEKAKQLGNLERWKK